MKKIKNSFFRKTLYTLAFYTLLITGCEESLLGPEAENTPENNFEILWKEFDLYYPSFIAKNVNWDSLYSVYRPMVTPQTTETELWEIIGQMLYHLNDEHVYVYNLQHTRLFVASGNNTRGKDEFSISLIKLKYLPGYKSLGEGRMTYGTISSDSIGYLHIDNFSGATEWTGEIDNVVNSLSGVKSIILDLRSNFGGMYGNYRRIASAFINSHIVYKQEVMRNGPKHYNLTDPFFVSLDPSETTVLNVPKILILTNRRTISAAESFVLAVKEMPGAVQIGTATAGSLGFSHRRFQLPNGWSYHMPTSLILTKDGECLESGIGIAPDIYVRNTSEEISDGYDRILEYTLSYLTGR